MVQSCGGSWADYKWNMCRWYFQGPESGATPMTTGGGTWPTVGYNTFNIAWNIQQFDSQVGTISEIWPELGGELDVDGKPVANTTCGAGEGDGDPDDGGLPGGP